MSGNAASATPGTAAYDAYRRATDPAPERVLAWNLYGVGVESMGVGGAPELVDLPAPAPDQLLVRVDAVGLCFSDVKLLRLGGAHPKLYGRDLAREPTRLGHETAVTVIGVGGELAERYRPGQRLAIQPDIYVGGKSTAYGYTIPGGLIEFQLIGPEVLAADDGAYVVGLDDRLGYAEAALTEPWACVEAAYTQRRRLEPLSGGRMLVVARRDDARAYRFGDLLAAPRELVISGAGPQLEASLRASAGPAAVSVVDDGPAAGPFDDIILLSPTDAALVSRAADALAFRGLLNLVADAPLPGPVELDLGRLHYHYIAYVGTSGENVTAAYGAFRNRAELRPGGVTVVVGAGGPMGQMHLERALGLPEGPRLVVGVDLDADRLAAAEERLRPLTAGGGRSLRLEVLDQAPDAMRRLVDRLTGGAGADDVVVTAPSAAAVVAASEAMRPDGMLVLFAGVPVGTRAALDLTPVFLHGAQYTGTSGSRIADQERVVRRTLEGQLVPRRAVAAVGGLESAPDALRALVQGRFAGKIVLFPALSDLPLTGLADLHASHPEVAAALDGDGSWTTDAEAHLFARHLRRAPSS